MKDTQFVTTEEKIITVKEARKLLGTGYDVIDDQTVEAITKELEHLATIILGFP